MIVLLETICLSATRPFALSVFHGSSSQGKPKFQCLSPSKWDFSPFSEWPGCYFWWLAWWWQGRGGWSRSRRRWRAWRGARWRAWRGERGGGWLTGLDGVAANPLKPQLEGSRAFRGGPAKLRWDPTQSLTYLKETQIKPSLVKIAVHCVFIHREVFEGPHSQEYWLTARTDRDWGNLNNQNSRYISVST